MFYKRLTSRFSGWCTAIVSCDLEEDWSEEGYEGGWLKERLVFEIYIVCEGVMGEGLC